MNEIRDSFQSFLIKYEKIWKKMDGSFTIKDKYTNIEISSFIQKILLQIEKGKREKEEEQIKNYLLQGTKKTIFQKIGNLKLIYHFQIKENKSDTKFSKKEFSIFIHEELKKINTLERRKIIDFIKTIESSTTTTTLSENHNEENEIYENIESECFLFLDKFQKIKNYLKEVKGSLDNSVYGHEKAKKQIETIIAQWLNGEQDGYCFGFEGPPGVGKTSLAKYGLSECLKDENGVARPFSMIQMGGDSNGSTLHGHNYTYVGSTWGNIVQILMDKKCMNPIIYIDEVDKISKTDHGKEITGILTHLLDTTQNDCFQDKYFSGIDLDLSKALFILSYNDANSIDKILLDRIHRIPFHPLSIQDKLIIANKHLLPEIYRKFGLENVVFFNDETLTFIVEEYTSEAGVRKLKEVLFEIIGELNLSILKRDFSLENSLNSLETEKKNENLVLPFEITIQDIKTNYCKDKKEMKHKKIHFTNCVGTINGLWANSYGQGGIIPIQSRFFPCKEFLQLKLTGMQGEVMKESMNVALTLAWNLTEKKKREEIQQLYNKDKDVYGIHIHCPEGSTPKDGPSAGTAITTVLYSLFNNKPIHSEFAITGEISLDGTINEIGGLDLKIIGGIKAGVKKFIYPKENENDFRLFMEKYRENEMLNSISFFQVSKIEEVFALIFDE
jgi:endopeptidase La